MATIDRVLRALPTGADTEPDAWFDYRTGRLMLPHFEHVEKLVGHQLDIIRVFWMAPKNAQLEWKNIKMHVNSAAKTIDDAFRGKLRREHFLEKLHWGRYRLRRT